MGWRFGSLCLLTQNISIYIYVSALRPTGSRLFMLSCGLWQEKLPECDAINGAGDSEYPTESNPYHISLGNHTFTCKCFVPGGKNDDDLKPNIECPPHHVLLGYEFDPSKYISQCQRACPLAIYSEAEYQALSITQILEGYFGFVMLVIVLVPFFINNPELGSFTFSMKLYIYISSGFVTLGLLWPSFFGHFRHVTCETNFQAASLYLFPCAVQGVLLYWGTASLAMWWFNVCLYLVAGSFAGLGYQTKALRFACYFFGWVCPTAGLLVALVSTKIGASPTSINCFLEWDAGKGWWANGLFYVEFTVFVSAGILMLWLATLRLLSIHGLKGLSRQGRLIIFSHLLALVFLFMLISWWVVDSRRWRYEQAADHWFGCLVERFNEAQNSKEANAVETFGRDYGCVLSSRVPFGLLYVQNLFYSAIPLAVAIIFGHSWYTWNMWGTIVCSFLCVAIQSLSNPSELLAPHTSSPPASPSITRRGRSKQHDIEMEESKVKFVALNSDDEEEDWAGDAHGCVVEGEFGGKRRKRTINNVESSAILYGNFVGGSEVLPPGEAQEDDESEEDSDIEESDDEDSEKDA